MLVCRISFCRCVCDAQLRVIDETEEVAGVRVLACEVSRFLVRWLAGGMGIDDSVFLSRRKESRIDSLCVAHGVGASLRTNPRRVKTSEGTGEGNDEGIA